MDYIPWSDEIMSQAPLVPHAPRRRQLLGCAFVLSLLFNVFAVALFVFGCLGIFFRLGGSEARISSLDQVHVSGDKNASDKIAILNLNGVLMEGLLGYAHDQIDKAARDDDVKAVVVRINSPGGTITASADIHRRLTQLTKGDAQKGTKAKPLVVSMGSIAASGGYYVAMPAHHILAEPTTLTGSIGVFVSLPNLTGTAEKIGFRLETIRQGEIKDSGSPFRDLTPKERLVWQDMIDHAYNQFIAVVEDGRPVLRSHLLEARNLQPVNAGPDWPHRGKAPPNYTRYLADGGIWTADKALEFNVIDQIGYLEDAIAAAHDQANLGERYHVIQYERPFSLRQVLLGMSSTRAPAGALDPERLQNALAPRIWYLAPGYEGSAFAASLVLP
jgi:protease-4